TDLDLGHYERFIRTKMSRRNISIYFQYLMECTDIYLIYGSSGASLPFLTAYPANNVMGSLSHGVRSPV
ncbi:hypothetical protein KX481_28025, partial [Escherichia coli]|nr:hypothetical protein [Escherichia coli]